MEIEPTRAQALTQLCLQRLEAGETRAELWRETDGRTDRGRDIWRILGEINLLDSGSVLICGGETPLDFNLGEGRRRGVGGQFPLGPTRLGILCVLIS